MHTRLPVDPLKHILCLFAVLGLWGEVVSFWVIAYSTSPSRCAIQSLLHEPGMDVFQDIPNQLPSHEVAGRRVFAEDLIQPECVHLRNVPHNDA